MPADLVDSSNSAADTAMTAETSIEEGDAENEDDVEEIPSQTAQDLHRILLETCIQEGKLVCGSCGHEYAVKEGVPNFLLPGHLV